ncbi:MAG: Mut7-C RNAse domain-containing protein [Candidatus Aminicenantales bacterium]
MKFVVDCMLGKLAKWLKILGFDVLYFPKAEDDELLELAEKEHRVLLSRDNALLARLKKERKLFVESEGWEDQVRQVLREFDLWEEAEPFSRCVECNVRMRSLPKPRAANLVAPFVYESARSFALCPRCGKIFWQGTHFDDMEIKLKDILKKEKN